MRLSTSMMYSNGLKGVLSQESDMNRLVEQVGSGRKFLSPADDPLSASLAINVAQTQAMNSTYQLNRNTAKTNLSQENNILDSVTTALTDVRTRVINAGNGTFADSDRQSLSTALKSARDALLGLANSTDGNGQYLFSGYQADRFLTRKTPRARSCIAEPPANAPCRSTSRARFPPATLAATCSAGPTLVRKPTSAPLRRRTPAPPSSAPYR